MHMFCIKPSLGLVVGSLCGSLVLSSTALASSMDEVIVRAHALPPSPSLAAFNVTTLSADDLDNASGPRLDDRLRSVPGFTLFRRSSSTASHPTSQGVSLRGIGPNGAGRTLVLVDGVPANDPFGGWVYWSAIAPAAVERVEIIRGGGAGPFGNAAIAGTVRINTKLPEGQGGYADLSYGSQATANVMTGVWATTGAWTVDLEGQYFETGGYYLIAADQRGAIDRRADSDFKRGKVGLTWRGDDGLIARASLSHFSEYRGNGTPGAINDTSSTEASLRVVQDRGDSGWEATIYGIDRSFASEFTAVTADRSAESPSLSQYDVPVKTIGGNFLWRQSLGSGTLELGADARWIDGATHEAFTFQNGAFQRDRDAGGEQILAGVFAEYTTPITASTQIVGGLRLDYLKDSHGQRREIEIASGGVLRDDHFTSRDRTVVNGRLGLIHDLSAALRFQAAAYSGFRSPTINELYRPFRVRNDITEANAALKAERLYGTDAGLRWSTADGISLSLTGYVTWLNDGIANVLIATAPGNYPDFGVFLPVGGTLNQRRNLDQLRTMGFEAEIIMPLTDRAKITARYLLADAKVTKANEDPALVGRRPTQVARHQGNIGFEWAPIELLTIAGQVRAESAQYDDALNQRRLPGYVTADAMIAVAASSNVSFYAAVDNIFDRTVITGESGDGLRSIAAPRQVRAGARVQF